MFYNLRYPAAVERSPLFFLQKGLQHPSRVYGPIELAKILFIQKRYHLRETITLALTQQLQDTLIHTINAMVSAEGFSFPETPFSSAGRSYSS